VLVLLIAHLIAALLAPLLVSRLGSRAFYLLALVPAAGFGWALTQTGTILDGRALVEVYPWVPSLDVDVALRVTQVPEPAAGPLAAAAAATLLRRCRARGDNVLTSRHQPRRS